MIFEYPGTDFTIDHFKDDISLYLSFTSHTYFERVMSTPLFNFLFLFNILWSLFDLGKCISNKLRNRLATLVVTFLLNGGLKQNIFRLQIRFYFLCSFSLDINLVY